MFKKRMGANLAIVEENLNEVKILTENDVIVTQ
jgi:hypothetical protein